MVPSAGCSNGDMRRSTSRPLRSRTSMCLCLRVPLCLRSFRSSSVIDESAAADESLASLGPRAYRSSRGAPGGGTGGRIGCEGGCGGGGAPPDGGTAAETPPGGGGPGGWDVEAILGIRKPPPPPPDDVAPAGVPAVAPSGGPSTIFPGGMTSSPVSRQRLQRAPGTGLVKCHLVLVKTNRISVCLTHVGSI